MHISHSTEINVPIKEIWDFLRSFNHVEKYLPIVSKTTLQGEGQGAKRICDVCMGTQIFQIHETLQNIDDSNYLMTISVDDGPIQIRGMEFTFSVKSTSEKKSDLTLSTNMENPDAQSMVENIFTMTGQGLKKFYEL